MTSFGVYLDRVERHGGSETFADIVRLASEATDSDLARLATILGTSGDQYLPTEPNMCIDMASTGGPSSLTTLVCPLVQLVLGYQVPKVGVPGRPAGGVDVLRTIPGYRTTLGNQELSAVMDRTGYAHIDAARFAPLDGELFLYRKTVGAVANPALAIASLLSKKLAVGLTKSGLEVRVSPHGNFGTSWKEAVENGRRYIRVATRLGIDARVVVTDASFPFQPYIGRGEALCALSELFAGVEGHWLASHFSECVAIASIFEPNPPDPSSLQRDLIREHFARNLAAQGSSIGGFDDYVRGVREQERVDLGTPSGFLVMDLQMLRDFLVSRQMAGMDDGDGVILMREPGAQVASTDTVVSLRSSSTATVVTAQDLGIFTQTERPIAAKRPHELLV